MDDSLHPLVERFADDPELYHRSRPGYPAELAELLTARLGTGPGTSALDLGAGTGKLTEVLLATGADVVAAEPVAALRPLLERVLPAERILDARAEALPLPDASLDLVACGDAFHWFDGTRAPKEIARVLRPGGHLVMVWHAPFPSEQGTWRSDLQRLLRSVRGEHPFFVKEHGRRALKGDKAFGPLRSVTVAHHYEVGRGGFIDYVRTLSYVSALQPGRWDTLVAELRDILDRAPARISLSYAVEVWITRRSG